MVAILILNWNGWQDTIDCIQSLMRMCSDDFFVIVGDNGSSNDSLHDLTQFISHIQCDLSLTSLDEQKTFQVWQKKVIIYDLKDNHGFARGNNLMIQYASRYSPEYYLLLNNDTEVEPDFLKILLDFNRKNPSYKVLTPLIHYYYDKDIIWNGGGNLIWGLRKYHYANKKAITVKEDELIECTYITGCALFFDPSVLYQDGTLLTERFFHGEEDFEFGHRMKKARVKMACVIKSVIYHKVGRSSSKTGKIPKLMYIHYLNRFIDLRTQLSPVSYYLFLFTFTPYLFYLLFKNGVNFGKSIRFYNKLIRECHILNSVSKEKFFSVMND